MDQLFPISFDTLALAVLGLVALRKLAQSWTGAHRDPGSRETA